MAFRPQARFVLVALAICAGARAATPSFWQVTDIHVDDTHDCSGVNGSWYGNFENSHSGCGVSSEGLSAATAFMKSEADAPDFIFFTGDAPWADKILPSLELIQSSLAAAFPSSPLFFLLGNHDFPGDPVGEDATSWYPVMAKLWGKWMTPGAVDEFAKLGYYSMLMPQRAASKVRLVALNTEHFNHGNDVVVRGDTLEVGMAQLAWLNETLNNASAHNESCYVFGHVPFGMETGYINDVSAAEEPGFLRPYWMSHFQRRYTDIIDAHADSVSIQVFGHEHTDTFRLAGKKSVIFTTPSLSCGYPRTNPTVRLWHHRPDTGTVYDWTQYHMDLIESNLVHKPLWTKSYVATEKYGLANLSRSSVEGLLSRFKEEHHNRTGNSSSHVYADERRFFWSSTPKSFAPECDHWCQTQDLCDKEFSGYIGTEFGFTTCLGSKGGDVFNHTSATAVN